ncbi:SAGA complex component (Sgf29) [Aspergillus nomiae NRRL 13137]|uniref:SAGA complex component (Sgf29) n=1 Tax=Aspergillus nomiae NRRL (strain ATCC 15546 / NRRL 13137 / CBS 260.88 / M93) TaxID=1509407 RepID=A0A0L1IUN9_ASPN3|nr:SAGA complex component (Sgf29) [Aspergillus nomiae NRRL 13137]KNG83281.1 SAGA complex component (Sgf29) [Aspergillus nomiae NRRL 13137]
MGTANGGVHWPAKRLPLNRDGNSASDSRQVGEPLSSPRQLEPGEHPTEETPSSPLSSFSRPHDLRQGAARGTRSARRKEIVSAFSWEALSIEKARTGELAISSGNSKGPQQRPIGPSAPRDNGLAANEETDMWNKILQDLRKAKEKNDKQKSLAEQISALNEKIGKDGGKPSLHEHNQLDSLYRQMLKLCEDERAILQDEPSDVIKNLGLLTALRQASEAEAPLNRAAALGKSRKKRNDVDGSATDSPGPSGASLPDKAGRIKGGIQRGSSVSSNQARDSRDSRDVHVKVEEGTEGTKGTLAERNGHLVVGAEVVFKHNKNKQGVEGEGIQCIIKGISGDGHKKRYDVQDPEPNENGEQGAVYKTTAASLIPIPQVGSTLPSFSVGKQVLARYPDTTTFYRAEVMGSRKDTYRLKFEGEEDDKEMEVDRRFVLDIPGK